VKLKGDAIMNVEILSAEMTFSKEDGFVGKVSFRFENHDQPYEIHLQKLNGKDWGYSLLFLGDSGKEEHILEVEDLLEETDELFDFLVETAKNTVKKD
jgi:hypothetical protein